MTMQISLNPQLEAIVNQKIASGIYHSASEVVGEALHLLEEYDHMRAAKLKALRKDIAIGLKQVKEGNTSKLSMEAIIKECNERLKNKD